MAKKAKKKAAPKKDKKKPKFIQKAIEKPGALRATAKRLGILKGDGDLTVAMLDQLMAHAKRTKNSTLVKRVNLAKTLKKMPRAKGPRKK